MNKYQRKVIQLREDFDKKGTDGNWLMSWNTPSGIEKTYISHTSLSGERWRSIERRVKNTHDKPTYRGCSNNFECFNSFVDWSRNEPGYDLKEVSGRMWAIDKDIIGDGQSYSQDNCIFVPQRVNNFLTLRTTKRGDYAIGVSLIVRGDKRYYTAGVNIGHGGATRLSETFYSEMDAHRFWQRNKIDYGRSLAQEFKGRHNRLFEGLCKWTDSIQEDFDNYRITRL